MALIGYARVSTQDQNLDLQRDALTKAGCAEIFEDRMSGAVDGRPGLAACLERLTQGDILVVWKLDRLGRSLYHLVDAVTALGKRGVDLRVLTGGIDTSTPQGRLVFGIFAVLAEFERELIRERILAGMAAAKARGRVGGRPRSLTEEHIGIVRDLLATHRSVAEIARNFGVDPSTIHRALKKFPLE